MAEEKKPKIDLKARLGKKAMSVPGGSSIPPPAGIPKPVGMARQAAVPSPFASQQAARKIDTSDPYSAISAHEAPARPAASRAITVEMSEEVLQAQRRGRSKVFVLAVITACVGGFLGFSVGSGVERGKGATQAVSGADTLSKEVEAANAEIERLAEVLKGAKQKLTDSKYPAEEVQKLGGIDIPFTGANLTDKGIGRFKAEVVTMLVSFASGAQEANDTKEKIQRLLSNSKPVITDLLQPAKAKVRWSVFVQNGPHGPWAVMQPLPTPFPATQKEKQKDKDGKEGPYNWPDEFKLTDGGKSFELKRYTSGDPTGAEPKIIPVDPSSETAVCPSDVLVKLRRELSDMEDTLRGVKGDPGAEEEKQGLLELGQALREKLKGIGAPGA